jgi:DNA-binding response OmpR family regulator
VLLVESHLPLGRALRQALEEEGPAVDLTGDLATADGLALTGVHDAIVLDLVRCREEGLALLRSWRQAGLTTGILALVAPAPEESDPAPGADDWLVVPFALDEFLRRVRTVARAGR